MKPTAAEWAVVNRRLDALQRQYEADLDRASENRSFEMGTVSTLCVGRPVPSDKCRSVVFSTISQHQRAVDLAKEKYSLATHRVLDAFNAMRRAEAK